MPVRERMSSVDTAWLRMDRPENLMTITGVLVFDERVSFARLRSVVAERLLAYARFRQRPVTDSSGAYWEDDAGFDLDRHLVRARLTGGRTPSALKDMVASLASAPIDPAHPLWQFTLVDNYGTGAALVARIHHCYADGIALIGVMLSLADETPDIPRKIRVPPSRRSSSEAEGGLLARFFEPMTDAVMYAVKNSGNALEKYVELVRNPSRLVQFAKVGAAIGAEIAQLATMPDDSITRFKGKPGVGKRVAWTAPMPLDEVKAVGRVLGCSVNDVLLASVAGALGSYLRSKGDDTSKTEIRALVPVNLRSPGKEHDLGNRFGLVALTLPLGMANPVARVHALHARMEALKGSYQAALTLGVLGLLGICPQSIQTQVLDLLASKATAVMTNVPGPQTPLFVAGARLASLMFWVPQSGDIGMGVSILSYNNSVQFGLITDAKLTPNPEDIVARFAPEFESLLLTVLMEPWDRKRDPTLIESELIAAASAQPAKSRHAAGPRRPRLKPSPTTLAE
ncbi:MAG: wax ester/triacylglycerol synthase family O-acyltransferase [Burkholderiales bacterium]